MPRFFADESQICASHIFFRGDDAHHIAHVLRMAVGDPLTVCDGRAVVYDCVIERMEDNEVRAVVCAAHPSETEPPFFARLYQALPKGDKLDQIIQKAVECGVGEIIPFESSRCVARVKPEAEAHKTQRRCRIAAEAAKQCGRGRIPRVLPTVDYEAMMRRAAEADLTLFCYEGTGTQSLRRVLLAQKDRLSLDVCRPPDIAIVIGSEGGFSSEEAAAAAKQGFSMIHLGPRILRTETASGFVLSCLIYEMELA